MAIKHPPRLHPWLFLSLQLEPSLSCAIELWNQATTLLHKLTDRFDSLQKDVETLKEKQDPSGRMWSPCRKAPTQTT